MFTVVRRPSPASIRATIEGFLAAQCPPPPAVEVTTRELRTLGQRLLKSDDDRLREAGRALSKLASNERYSAPHSSVEHDPFRCAECARDLWWLWCVALAYPNADAGKLWVRLGALQGLRADEMAVALADASESETPDQTRERLLHARGARRECFPDCEAHRTRGFGACLTCSLGVTPSEDLTRAALVSEVRYGTNPRTVRAKRRAEAISTITPADLRKHAQ